MVQERPGHYSLSLLFRVSPSFYVLAVVKANRNSLYTLTHIGQVTAVLSIH